MVRAIAFLALLPIGIGPLPAADVIVKASICSAAGRQTVEIPLPARHDERRSSHHWGCHAICPRKKIDPAQ